jgi:hypothetical protein
MGLLLALSGAANAAADVVRLELRRNGGGVGRCQHNVPDGPLQDPEEVTLGNLQTNARHRCDFFVPATIECVDADDRTDIAALLAGYARQLGYRGSAGAFSPREGDYSVAVGPASAGVEPLACEGGDSSPVFDEGVGMIPLTVALSEADLPLPGSRAAIERWGEAGRGLRVERHEIGRDPADEAGTEPVPLLLFSERGLRVRTCADLAALRPLASGAIPLYWVPRSEHFIYPVHAGVGHKIVLDDLPADGVGEDPFVRELEVLSERPRVFRIRNFLTDDECDGLRELAEPQLFQSKLFMAEDEGKIDTHIRGSQQAWVQDDMSDVTRHIRERTMQLSRVPSELSIDEQFQVLRCMQLSFASFCFTQNPVLTLSALPTDEKDQHYQYVVRACCSF